MQDNRQLVLNKYSYILLRNNIGLLTTFRCHMCVPLIISHRRRHYLYHSDEPNIAQPWQQHDMFRGRQGTVWYGMVSMM